MSSVPRSRRCACVAAIVAAGTTQVGLAVPIAEDPTWTVHTYDTGGNLNPGSNGGYYLGGLEVDPNAPEPFGRVFVIGHDVPPGGASSFIQIIRSTGLNSSALDPAGGALQQITRANDLTYNPDNGQYCVAATRVGLTSGGVYGFTPGTPGFSNFQQGAGIPAWETSGLTFSSPSTARVTSDVGIGHHAVNKGLPFSTLLVDQSPLPNGYEDGADDHVRMLDNTYIVAGDQTRKLYDVTNGPGTVTVFFDLFTIPGFSDHISVGSRATVDPITGDLFIAYALGGTQILRVYADGSGGEVFASGFVDGVRDIDFGPSSLNDGTFSLYATEIAGGVGSIYEFRIIPSPGTLTMLVFGASAALRRRPRPT